MVAVLARALPADVIQKLILVGIFVLACGGAARLLSAERWPAKIAAGIAYAWNPFVAERLLLGQWATLLGYAGLPWVLGVVISPPAWPAGRRAGLVTRSARLVVALLPAAVGGFAAMSISGLVALPAAVCQHGTARSRVARSAVVLVVLGVLSLPWLVPSLARQVHTSPAAVAAFAARADTPAGAAGSLLALGGGWNAQTVPAGYGGATSVVWLWLVLGSLAGFLVLGRRRWPGLGVGAAVGLLIALLGIVGAGRTLLRDMITFWPGFAVLRDGQQFVAPLALAGALGLGLLVAAVLRAGRSCCARAAGLSPRP